MGGKIGFQQKSSYFCGLILRIWVGQSEKNVKALFDRYREQVKRAKLTPILLFNEADAIIGKRKNGAENAVDKMENSLQNIILQEMETLEGIMIATTNLQQNMDKAFERELGVYRIEFKKPPRREAHLRLDLLPEVGVDLHDEAFLHPAVDDGLHYRRLVVGQSEVHQVFFRELLGQRIQIAHVTL